MKETTFDTGDHLTKPRLVFGCGNPLFGDDGFGPAVIAHLLERYSLPADTACLDAGTAVRDFLFDILLWPHKPRQLILVDAMQLANGTAGEIREINVAAINPAKLVDYSLHQFPTTNMLRELQDHTPIGVRLLVAHPAPLPEEVSPGLSPAMKAAVPRMAARVMEILTQEFQ